MPPFFTSENIESHKEVQEKYMVAVCRQYKQNGNQAEIGQGN